MCDSVHCEYQASMVLWVVLEFVVSGRSRPTLLILNGGCLPSEARQNNIFFNSALAVLVGHDVCYFR